nr:hypothetical protein Iba_scaffold2471.2CG0080 [Ipomoea batatas]
MSGFASLKVFLNSSLKTKNAVGGRFGALGFLAFFSFLAFGSVDLAFLLHSGFFLTSAGFSITCASKFILILASRLQL